MNVFSHSFTYFSSLYPDSIRTHSILTYLLLITENTRVCAAVVTRRKIENQLSTTPTTRCSPRSSPTRSPLTSTFNQWVPLYLLGLAILFYLPRMFWLMVEGGLMKFFGQGTTSRWKSGRIEMNRRETCLFYQDFKIRFVEDQDEKRERLVKYFCKNIHNK